MVKDHPVNVGVVLFTIKEKQKMNKLILTVICVFAAAFIFAAINYTIKNSKENDRFFNEYILKDKLSKR